MDTYYCAEPAFLQAKREFRKAQEFERRVLAPRAKASPERMEREHFGEVGKERSRRKMFYSHNWSTREGYSPQTAVIARDAALLAENCGVLLQLSSENPELGPMFEPDLILCNGRGDSCDDFRYPPDGAANPAAGRRANSGRCKTELRDYDTLVCAILLSVKHHLGDFFIRQGRRHPRRRRMEGRIRTLPPHPPGTGNANARQLAGNWALLLSLVARPHHCANTPSSLTFKYTEDSQVTSQKHQQLSEHLLAEARQELAAGGLPQASEYGWGATTQILKAIAEQRGWEHHRHRHYLRIASRLRAETGDGDILRLFAAARVLHENFYENDMSADDVADGLDDVEALLDKLKPMLDES